MACPIHGLLGLLLRSSGAVGSAIEVTAAQDFERPRLSHPHQVSALRSALVYLMAGVARQIRAHEDGGK